MKVVASENGTIIHPFASPDQQGGDPNEYIIVYPNGSITLSRRPWPEMDAEAARQLAEALLHATEIAQSGQK